VPTASLHFDLTNSSLLKLAPVPRLLRDVDDVFARISMTAYRSTGFTGSRYAVWAPLLLRLIVGYGFIAHGVAKLTRGPDIFAAALHGLGVPAPHLMSWVTIVTELLGGVAILLGGFVTFFSLPLAVILLVAMFTVHLPYGFSSIKLVAVTAAGPQFGPPGYECNLLYLACLGALVLAGPGPLAIDCLRQRKR
jgi:putative oxidoreductase